MIFRYIRLETVQVDFDCVVGKIYRFFSAVNRTLRFWRLDRYVLPEDLKTKMLIVGLMKLSKLTKEILKNKLH